MKQDTIPAVERTIKVLRLLSGRTDLSLQEISEETCIPGPTLMRLLESLKREGVVSRDAVSKRFSLLEQLVPVGDGGAGFRQQILQALENLAEDTSQTAEWYVPSERGMVLVQRFEPKGREVRVSAKLGFCRPWLGELDAVCALGNAWFRPDAEDIDSASFYWNTIADGESYLKKKQIRDRLAEAKEKGVLADSYFNANAVRRIAAVVCRNGKPRGVIAIAEFSPQQDFSNTEAIASALVEITASF